MEEHEAQHVVTSGIPEICIDPKDYDPSRLILKDPETMTFSIGQSEVSMTTSAARYLDDEGKECLMYFSAPPQQTFGVSYTFPMEVKEADQTPENAKGFQISYPLTSLKTVKNPTEAEQAYIDMLDSLWQAAVEKGREEALKDGSIPEVAANSFIAAERKGEKWELAVKKPAEYPKTADKKNFDTTKPMRQYLKLITTGKGPTLKAMTPFYGSKNQKCNAVKFLDKRGIIEPCFLFEGLYYGSHGPRAPHGCSLRFKLAEANYTEISSVQGVPSKKLLRANTSVGGEEEVDEGCEDGTFSEPTPAQALKKAVAKTGAKTGAKVATKAPVKKVAVAKTTKTETSTKVAPVKKAVAKSTKVAKAPAKKAVVKKAKEEVEEDEEENVEEDE